MSDIEQATLGVWDKFYDQANPLVVFHNGEWLNLTVPLLVALFRSESSVQDSIAVRSNGR